MDKLPEDTVSDSSSMSSHRLRIDPLALDGPASSSLVRVNIGGVFIEASG
jgi:hypothetical protein